MKQKKYKPDFKRPDHPDFMDSSELRKLEFSGVRANKLTQQMELWVLGEVVKTLSMIEANLHPEKWEALYAEVFCLGEVKQTSNELKPVEKKSGIILPY